MTDCTERHPAAPGNGPAGEGQEGRQGWQSMTDCTERHPAPPGNGPEGMPGVTT